VLDDLDRLVLPEQEEQFGRLTDPSSFLNLEKPL
jgi:hypothetical protein